MIINQNIITISDLTQAIRFGNNKNNFSKAFLFVKFWRIKQIKMKKIIYITCMLSILTFSLGCKKPKKDKKLSISQTPNNSNLLKLNGYYYYEYSGNNELIKDVYLFYRDGQIISFSISGGNGFLDLENYLVSDRFKSQIQSNKDMHGLYLIENQNLVTEKWAANESGYLVNRSEGLILNDSTFEISNTGASGNLLYKFKSYSPKPDSTNKFIP
jgi:hypothetical protein